MIGPYSLVATLGQGGMGVVYLAVQSPSEVVAIKTLLPGQRADGRAVARFEREIELAMRFKHTNVVRAIDSGHYRGVPFLVMEYLDGIDLSRLLECCGPVSIVDACEIARQMAVGLEEIHRRGFIHRDIKPSNVLVTRQGTVKVLDMGLAFAARSKTNSGGVAVSDQCVGTLNYMAPEQFEDSWSVTPAVDLYGLGATLFELLCGIPPSYGAQSNPTRNRFRAAATCEALPLTLCRPETCEPLAALVARLLSEDPREPPLFCGNLGRCAASICRRKRLDLFDECRRCAFAKTTSRTCIEHIGRSFVHDDRLRGLTHALLLHMELRFPCDRGRGSGPFSSGRRYRKCRSPVGATSNSLSPSNSYIWQALSFGLAQASLSVAPPTRVALRRLVIKPSSKSSSRQRHKKGSRLRADEGVPYSAPAVNAVVRSLRGAGSPSR